MNWRRLIALFLIFFGSMHLSLLHAEEDNLYTPYPVLFAHGIGSDAGDWDATRGLPDFDSGLGWYFSSIDPKYPGWNVATKPYLEAFSFSNNVGSIDPDHYYQGEGTELKGWIEDVLTKYYGSDWDDLSGPDTAKLVIVCHSMGGLATRQSLKEFPELKPHIHKVILLGTPNKGSELEYLQYILRYGTYLWTLLNYPKLGLMVAALEEYIEDMHPYNSFTPAGYDLTPHSGFFNQLGSYQGDGFPWHCLIGRHPVDDLHIS